MSNENWHVRIDPSVYKSLAKFPKKDRERIVAALEELGSNPYAGDVVKLGGEENAWRRRIGAYRIFYEIETKEKTVDVAEVERRGSKTY